MNRYLTLLQELTPLLSKINMNVVVIAKQTKLRHYLTKKGESKKKEYLQIEGAPLIVINFENDIVTLNSLTSSFARKFNISKQELVTGFIPGQLDDNNIITNLDKTKYPLPVNVSEFQWRDDFVKFEADIKTFVKSLKKVNPLLQKIFHDKLFQMIQTQGAPFEKIVDIEKFIENGPNQSKHTRFGNPIFNRNCRWCPVADHLTWEQYETCPSYPYPIGIRAKDFCLPSEMHKVLVEMIKQILTFKNVDEKHRQNMQTIFSKYNVENVFDNITCHCCKYCGCEIDMNAYTSQYKSEHNYIEICHRDPNSHFCVKNMYWGHGECNRRQGGYTESDRIQDAIGLINYNSTDYSLDQLQNLMKACEIAITAHSTKSD